MSRSQDAGPLEYQRLSWCMRTKASHVRPRSIVRGPSYSVPKQALTDMRDFREYGTHSSQVWNRRESVRNTL